MKWFRRNDSWKLTSRALTVSEDRLRTLDVESRSIEVVAATESPVTVMDWERWEPVREVLLMSGAKIPKQIPLLDAHSRTSSRNVLGSVRDLRVESGELIGKTIYSTVNEADEAFTKLREGHLTDYSIGYSVDKSVWVDDGKTKEIQGRTFEGPVRVATKWTVRELSTVPIGADEHAKARAKYDTRSKEPDVKTQPKETEDKEVIDDNVQAAVRAAQKEERTRVSEISAIGQRFEVENEARQAIDDGVTIEVFRQQVLDAIEKRRQETPGHRVDITVDASDKFRAAGTDAMLIRSGFSVEKPAYGADDLTGFSLVEIARACLRNTGERSSGNPLDMIGRAFTHSTSDFPLLLANIAHKSLAKGFEKASETWQSWCNTGSVSDFKIHTRVRPGEVEDLEKIEELREYEYGTRSEAQEHYAIATYGKMYNLSRQMIINDDLSALTDIPREHGEAAARKVGDIAYSTLFANEAMGDLASLFHEDHNNRFGPLPWTIKNLGEVIAAMRLQMDIGKRRRLNIRPQYLIAPVGMETMLEQFFRSNLEGTQAKPNLINPFAGSYLQRIYEARVDEQNELANRKCVYLAGPKGKTVTVFFLNGSQKPYLETKNGWSRDGVEFKVRIDAGAKAMDWRALSELEIQ